MSSSATDSSDWNQPNLPFEVFDQATISREVRGETTQAIPTAVDFDNASSSTPQLDSISNKLSTSDLATTTSGSNTPVEVINHGNNDQQSQQINLASQHGLNQNDAGWQAAREKVLETIQSSEVATPTSKLKGGAKTGSRRSRGGAIRQPRIKAEPGLGDDSPSLSNLPPTGRTVNRGGRPRGSRAGASSSRGRSRGGRPRGSRAGLSAAISTRSLKRKRKKRSDDDDEDGPDSSGSEAMILPPLSSSGRRISQAKSFTATVLDPEIQPTSSIKKARFALHGTDAAPATYIPPALKRKHARNPAEAAVCRSCGRGHSPQNNQIVFCDSCNTPWHQYCHDRPISPTVVRVEESEWRCSDCNIEDSLSSFGRDRMNTETFLKTTGINPTLQWKQDYLMSVPKETLVRLLLKAEDKQEDLPLFEPTARIDLTAKSLLPELEKKAEQQPKQTKVTVLETSARTTIAEDGEEDGHKDVLELVLEDDEGYSEEPLPYPKMGNGLVLPPEEEDRDILVDENEAVYSHSWQDGSGTWKGPFAQEDAQIRGVCQWCHNSEEPIGFRSRFCLRCRQELAFNGQSKAIAPQTSEGPPLTNGYRSDSVGHVH